MAVAFTSDTDDISSTSLTNKESKPTAESLSSMDDATQLQEQSMDVSCNLDGSSADATQLKADVSCGPAAEGMASSEPTVTDTAESFMSCQSLPSSADIDIEMKSGLQECSQGVETGSQENADGSGTLREEGLNSISKEENAETTVVHQSVDGGKPHSCEAIEEMLFAYVEAATEEAAVNDAKEHSVVEPCLQLAAGGDAVSAETTPPSGKDISDIVDLSNHCMMPTVNYLQV